MAAWYYGTVSEFRTEARREARRCYISIEEATEMLLEEIEEPYLHFRAQEKCRKDYEARLKEFNAASPEEQAFRKMMQYRKHMDFFMEVLTKHNVTVTHDDSQNTGFDWRVESPWTQFDTFKTREEAVEFGMKLARQNA